MPNAKEILHPCPFGPVSNSVNIIYKKYYYYIILQGDTGLRDLEVRNISLPFAGPGEYKLENRLFDENNKTILFPKYYFNVKLPQRG
jgi:hypothetical protein